MKHLDQLQTEQVNLTALQLEVNNTILTAEQQLEASFSGKTDSDKLSQKLAQLRAKQSGLVNAIESNAKSLITEEQRLVDEEKAIELDQRKHHVMDALKSLDRAVKLQSQLSIELQKVVDHNTQALFRNHSEIEQSVRAVVGRLAAQFKLYGSLQMAAELPVSTSDDYDSLITHINRF